MDDVSSGRIVVIMEDALLFHESSTMLPLLAVYGGFNCQLHYLNLSRGSGRTPQHQKIGLVSGSRVSV